MRKELVLNEDDKKKRFQRFLTKKKESQSFDKNYKSEYTKSTEESPPPLMPIRPVSIDFTRQTLLRKIGQMREGVEPSKLFNSPTRILQEYSCKNLAEEVGNTEVINRRDPVSMKDFEALNYFAQRGLVSSFANSSMVDLLTPSTSKFSSVTTFSSGIDRQSVITFPPPESCDRIKTEIDEENFASKRKYCDQDNFSPTFDIGENSEENYIHKKFRIKTEKIQEDQNLQMQKRKSVIFYSSSVQKISV